MQIDHHHFFHAVFYHFRCEEILFSFPLHCYFPVVFLEKDRFGFFIMSFISDLCTMNLCSILRKKIIQLLKYCYCNITWTKSHETDLQKNYLNTPNYQQYGTDGFSWVSHVDGTIITHHFRHVWQCSTVIKMKMTEIIITVWYENSQNLNINFCNILNLLVLFTIHIHVLSLISSPKA